MLTLRELQSDICRSVTGHASEELLRLIAGDGLDPATRLSIYRNNVVTRLTHTLRGVYPVVCKLVDSRFFDYAAEAFLRDCLPASGCLSEYGGEFPSFLAAFPPAAEPKYLPDIARLEWAVHCVRRAAEFPSISIGAVAAIGGDPALFQLRLAPAVQFIASPYAIDQIWIAHQEDHAWDDLRLRNAGVQLQVSGVNGLNIVDLPPSTWEFRARLADGERLGAAIAAGMSASAQFDLPSALASLFREGIVVGVTAGAGCSPP